MYIHGQHYHPTFLYESIGCLLGFLLIIFVVKRFQKKQGIVYCHFKGKDIVKERE